MYGDWVLGAERTRLTGKKARDLPRLPPQTDHIDQMAAIMAVRVESLREATSADQDRGSPFLAEVMQGRAEPGWRSAPVLADVLPGRAEPGWHVPGASALAHRVVAWPTPQREAGATRPTAPPPAL